jgi:hypothetical protein
MSLPGLKAKGNKMIRVVFSKPSVVLIAVCILITGSATAQTTVKQEPAMGAMQEGEVVLVDDGSCPKGQIKRVIGGNHVKAGGFKQIVRTRSCVPR